MKTIILILGLVLCVGFSPANTLNNKHQLHYQVLIGGKNSGTFMAEKYDSRELGQHLFIMQTRINYLFWDIDATLKSNFMQKKLHESHFKEIINGSLRDQTSVKLHPNDSYQISRNKTDVNLKEAISFSTAMLYHHEPVGETQIFTERHGKFCPLRMLGTNYYELTLPNGTKNTYRYLNGICVEMTTRVATREVRFVLQK